MSGILNNVYNNSSFALYLHSKAINKLQEQYASGSRINRASDDPSGAYHLLGLHSQKRALENYISTIDNISSVLEMSTSVIGEMTKELSQIKANINQIISGTYSDSGREIVAEGINDAIEKLLNLANTKHNGNYIYGGSDTKTCPYIALRDSNGNITNVIYQGSDTARDVQIAPGINANAYYAGQDIFKSNNRGTPNFIGNTGAAAGKGTSSVTGNVWLKVTHDGTDYNLSIGGNVVDLGTVADLTNVAVKDTQGNVLYVDATGINSTGYDLVSVEGTHDIFNTLITTRDLLLNEKELSNSQLIQCRNALTQAIDEVNVLLVGKETSIGSKIGFLEDLKNSLGNMKNNTEDETAAIEDADIAQISIDLAKRETLYQMTLLATGKLMSMSLLDFID